MRDPTMAGRVLEAGVIVLICLAHPAAAKAQAVSRDLEDVLRVADQRNWYVRVTGEDTVAIDGRVSSVRDGHVRVGSASIQMADIRIIERRSKSGGGALPGALLGSAIGGVALGLVMGNRCGAQCFVTFGLLGGAAGGLAGGMAGSAAYPGDVRWHREWQLE